MDAPYELAYFMDARYSKLPAALRKAQHDGI